MLHSPVSELEARQWLPTVGLGCFLLTDDDTATDMAVSGCGRAATESFIPPHTRAAVVADLRDHAVLLMKLRERHSLHRRRHGYGKSSNSDQSDHFTASSINLQEELGA
jgi:hypothetical protein